MTAVATGFPEPPDGWWEQLRDQIAEEIARGFGPANEPAWWADLLTETAARIAEQRP